MPRTRAQRGRDTVNEGGWADLPGGLMAKVLELLQAAGRNEPQEGGFSQATATVRLVCAAWQGVHDATVTRLVLRRETTDQAMGMLVRRFPTVVSLEVKARYGEAALTDQGLRAVSSLPSLTFLDLTWCCNVTDAGVRAVVSSCTALKSLRLFCCKKLTDEGVRAVSSLPALTSLNLAGCNVTDEGVRAVVSSCAMLTELNLYGCRNVTDEGVRAVSNLPALTELNLRFCKVADEGVRAVSTCTTLTALDLRECFKLTDEAVRALSSLPALTSLDLRCCFKATAAGVQVFRSSTAAPSLHIESRW
jgi:hypothetical protein